MIQGLFNTIRKRRRKQAIKQIIEQYTRILELETGQRQKTELFRRLEQHLEQLERQIERAGKIEDKQQQLQELKEIIEKEKIVAQNIEEKMREIERAGKSQKEAARQLKRNTR